MSPAFAIAILLLVSPQEPAAASPLETFKALPEDKQSLVMRALERRVMLDPDPTIQTIVSMARGFDSYPLAQPRIFHDPMKWARGKAPERTLVRAGSAQHERVRKDFPVVPFLTDLHKAVWYDWGTGQVVRRAERLRGEESFENLLRGYPPGTDAAVAHVVAVLDTDSGHRPMAAFLDHLYADLKARVYEDITLYEAWYSGEILDVPDVDAVPFAVQILETRSFRSPIPPGPRRTWLYQQIREHTLTQRRYRSLREAAAGGFVRAEPILDPTYLPLVPRFHYLWPTEEDDPERLAAWLAGMPDRATFVAKTDARFKASPESYVRREARRAALAAMAEKLRALAVQELARAR